MSASSLPKRSRVRPENRAPSPTASRVTGDNLTVVSEPGGSETRTVPLKKGEAVFNPGLFLAKAGLGRKVVHLEKGELAYAQGDPADALFYVKKGRLRVTVNSSAGKEATLALVGAGEFAGENCMISAHPVHLATAAAMDECELLRISKVEMVRVLHEDQELSDMFVAFLLARNARIQADLVDQLFNSSEKRLARVLLLLAQFGKDSKPETVIPKISQEVLAEMIGTTRSRVSFFMNRFRKLGFIEYDGEIRVHNSLLNIFLQE
jgi:CRP/FNR family cyclic AMP-dependent transcriptional regulator